jgi:hypothetical protein
VFVGHSHDAWQRPRRLHDGEAGVAPESIFTGQSHDEVETLVLDAGEGPRRIEAERREYRLHLPFKVSLEPQRRRRVPGGACEKLDPLEPQRRQQHVVQTRVLCVDQAAGTLVYRAKQFGDGQAIRAGLIGTELYALLEAGDADLEKLVQIVRRDAQEFESLEQRYLRVERLREDPPVEFEQRQFAIDVVLGGAEIGLVHGAAGLISRYENTAQAGLM